MNKKTEGVEYGTKTKTYVSKTFAMPPALHTEFTKFCNKTGQFQNEVIIEAIIKYLKNFKSSALE